MYESFFQLCARPFLSTPIAERYFPAASAEHARETVARCVERAEGPALILGPAGTGKSTLCQVLAQQLRDRFRVAMLASARLCTRRALLQNILFELKLPYRDRDEGELRLSLIDALEPSDACPHGMLLVVDEAHMLPLRLLEEIRMITNLVRQGQPRVRLVLAAGMVLDERMASPRLESFNQRVAARCYLQSMNREETCGYVRAQLAAVGGNPDRMFTPDALHAVYRATDGIPRLVNQVCDHVLLLAAVGRRQIDTAGVEEAWSDLQQLPTPWTRDTDPPASDILEFGQLDDVTCGELDAGDLPVDAVDAVDALAEDLSAPGVASPAAAHLDRIEHGISALATEHDGFADEVSPDLLETQFRPQLCRAPEVELIFHHAHNPFAERFDEEEVIVDPFAAQSHDGRPHGPLPTEARPVEESSTAAMDGSGAPLLDLCPGELDPVLPEQADLVLPPMVTGGAASGLPGDDRDLLDILDDTPSCPEDYALAIAAYRPRRREYRQLFASLRGR